MTGARFAWHDATVRPAADQALEDFELHATHVRWPLPDSERTPAARASASDVPVSRPATASLAIAASAPSDAASTRAPAARPTTRATDATSVRLQAHWVVDPARRAAPGSLAASAVVQGGQGTDVEVDARSLAIAPLRSYIEPYLEARVSGVVGLHARAHWEALPVASPATLDVDDLRIDQLDVRDAATPGSYAAWRQASLQGLHADFSTRQATLAQLQLTQPDIGLRRSAEGGFEAMRWIPASGSAAPGPDVPPADSATPGTAVATRAPAPRDAATPPDAASSSRAALRQGAPARDAPASASAATRTGADWQFTLGHAAIQAGRVHWRDARAGGTVAADLEAIDATLDNARWPAVTGSTWPVKLAARVLPGGGASTSGASAGAGRVEFAGQVGAAPVAWRGKLRIERLPLHLADAYVASTSPLFIDHADLGWQGAVDGTQTAAGLRLHLQGDALLTDVRTCARGTAEDVVAGAACDLLTWQSLAAQGTEVTVNPGHAPGVAVADVALDKASARLVITEQGRFNLTDLAGPPPATSATASTAAPTSTTATPPTIAGASATTTAPAASAPSISLVAPASAVPSSSSVRAASTSAAVVAAAPPPPPSADAPDIRIANLHWTDSRVDYTDRFVKPNYSADLDHLAGRLGGFSSRSSDPAPLELTGRVAGTGLLDVRGKLNPLAKPLALDVTAKATDIELAPLSPYAGKYAGYAIERGKLSVDLHYHVEPGGRLEASNRVVLNQLTFGDRVDSPVATRLPVLFAVALLKDRHGVIDVDLPIGGSIDDPDFSVGGIIWKLILNLLGKALTAPFALLSGGGQDDLSQVLFVPGTARLREGGDAALDKVARALTDRPALQLTITGLADDDQEHAAMQAANLETRLAGLRRTELLQQGQANPPDMPAWAPEDRARLVKRLYADAKLPDKPRNVIGLAKDLPQADMEARLMAGLPLPAEAARQLAIQRAQSVRDALAGRGLPDERMFVAAPKVHGAGSAEPQAWSPHAQLELATR